MLELIIEEVLYKMNRKGFTLVELLAVILILLSISLVSVVSITSSLNKRDESECKEQKELAVNAAKIYFSLVDNAKCAGKGNITPCVYVKDLIDQNYFNEKSKYNKIGCGNTDTGCTDRGNYVTIEVTNGKSEYKFKGECSS